MPPASVVMSIRNGFILPFCSLALFREGHSCIFNNKLDFALAEGSSQYRCVCVFIKLHISMQSGPPVILVILCYARIVFPKGGSNICILIARRPSGLVGNHVHLLISAEVVSSYQSSCLCIICFVPGTSKLIVFKEKSERT